MALPAENAEDAATPSAASSSHAGPRTPDAIRRASPTPHTRYPPRRAGCVRTIAGERPVASDRRHGRLSARVGVAAVARWRGPRHPPAAVWRALARGYPGGVILGIDTSLGTAVALVEPDGMVVAEATSDDPFGHAEVIGDLLVRVLADAPPAPVTYVAAGMGPGPFTGLRVGIAAARSFALGRGVPVLPVPSHDAIALGLLLHAAMTDAAALRLAVVTDARRRELAYTVYDGLDDDGLPRAVTEPTLAPRADLDARLAELGAQRREAGSVSASMIALAAARALAAGRAPAVTEPLYLRAPDVTLSAGPKRVTA